jgi:hypothetical protein
MPAHTPLPGPVPQWYRAAFALATILLLAGPATFGLVTLLMTMMNAGHLS